MNGLIRNRNARAWRIFWGCASLCVANGLFAGPIRTRACGLGSHSRSSTEVWGRTDPYARVWIGVSEPSPHHLDPLDRSVRARVDWAHTIRELIDVHYPNARKSALVQDNRNTPTKGALYEAFAPAEAKRLCDRIEWHYTPKHGSWLNRAEIEFRVLTSQCSKGRIGDKEELTRIVSAWPTRRNASPPPVDWRFTTDDARIKLKRLYPQIQT